MKRAYLTAAASAALLTFSVGSASAQDWSGGYFGVSGGYNTVDESDDERILFDTNLDGGFNDTVRTTTGADAFADGPIPGGFCGGTPNGNNFAAGCEDDEGRGEFSVRLGLDFQSGSFVYGILAEYAFVGAEDSATAFSTTPANYAFVRELTGLTSARARLGYAYGRFLPYVTAGGAVGRVRNSFTTTNAANSFTPVNGEDDRYGFQVGGGVETKLTERASVGVEYIYTSLDDDDGLTVRTGPGTAPLTNPFRIVNPAGTDQRREETNFNLHAFRVTGALRF